MLLTTETVIVEEKEEKSAMPDVYKRQIFFAQPVISEETFRPGTIDSDGETWLNVACADGWLSITDIQLSGKKRMGVADFLRGFRDIVKYRFE